jgi:hypothetical protein
MFVIGVVGTILIIHYVPSKQVVGPSDSKSWGTRPYLPATNKLELAAPSALKNGITLTEPNRTADSLIYVQIAYCSGLCPDNFPPPSGVLLYTSLADCQENLQTFPSRGEIVDEKGRVMLGTHEKMTCASVFGDKKQFDRLFDPQQLAQLLKENGK